VAILHVVDSLGSAGALFVAPYDYLEIVGCTIDNSLEKASRIFDVTGFLFFLGDGIAEIPIAHR
jgi:hypothetical protein